MWGRSSREDLCLSDIPVLTLTAVSMQLCGRVHLHTERIRKEERGRETVVGWSEALKRKRGRKKNYCLPDSEGGFFFFWWRSQRDFFVCITASSSIGVCLYAYIFVFVLYYYIEVEVCSCFNFVCFCLRLNSTYS